MPRLRVAPIVEGHGDVIAVPILIRRICGEISLAPDVEVLKPIRQPRSKLVKPEELHKAVELAELKLRTAGPERGFILILFDADEDAACELGPSLQVAMRLLRPDLDISVVLAVAEYETWFIASADSLEKYLWLDEHEPIPEEPESNRKKKAWIQDRFRGQYTETIAQPALTAQMDLRACRQRAPSFDKLCRELEERLT